MGLWDGIKKMAQGKPVFEANGQPNAETHLQDKSVQVPQTAPTVAIEDVDCHESGTNLEVWVAIKNTANAPIFLDKMYLLSQKTELDTELAPGAIRKYRVYRGSELRNKPTPYADVNYKRMSDGDYFQARFFVEYDYESNGTYKPEEFHLQQPIHDI